MSLALESLMRRSEAVSPAPSGPSGIFSFLAIGGGAAAGFVLVSSVAVAQFSHVESWVVSALCYAAFVVPVYLLHRRFTFRSQALHREALPRYVAVQALGLMLATLFGFLFHGTMALPSVASAMLVIALTSGVNYLVLKGWAFAFPERQPEVVLA